MLFRELRRRGRRSDSQEPRPQMSQRPMTKAKQHEREHSRTRRFGSRRLRRFGNRVRDRRGLGPGLVVAATGVGAADRVGTLVAGSQFGYGLLWAVIVGVILKIVLVEGAGRFSLATGKTIFEGWRSLGRWTTWYFGPYIIIWG